MTSTPASKKKYKKYKVYDVKVGNINSVIFQSDIKPEYVVGVITGSYYRTDPEEVYCQDDDDYVRQGVQVLTSNEVDFAKFLSADATGVIYNKGDIKIQYGYEMEVASDGREYMNMTYTDYIDTENKTYTLLRLGGTYGSYMTYRVLVLGW